MPITQKTADTIKMLSSLGLGVVIAWVAFSYLIRSDQDNKEFLHGELKANTAAQVAVSGKLDAVADAMQSVAKEMDDVSDTTRESNAVANKMLDRVDRLIEEVWKGRRSDVRPASSD